MFAPLPHGASDSTADSCRNHPDGDALPFPLLCATPPPSQDHLQPSIHRLWFIYQWYSVITNAQFANLPKRTIRSEKETRDGANRFKKKNGPFLHHAGATPLHTTQSPEHSREAPSSECMTMQLSRCVARALVREL